MSSTEKGEGKESLNGLGANVCPNIQKLIDRAKKLVPDAEIVAVLEKKKHILISYVNSLSSEVDMHTWIGIVRQSLEKILLEKPKDIGKVLSEEIERLSVLVKDVLDEDDVFYA
jgi:hypothetical protein